MSRYSHLTPRYVFDRVKQIAFERRNPHAPWLTAGMIDILDQWVRPGDQGLEWGSGRSTAWLAARIGQLVTVEDDADWADKVQAMLAERGFADRVELNRIPIDPLDRSGSSAYVAVASRHAVASLDFCLVDGDLRDHCALAALPLIKPGGLLIIDNVERYLPRKAKTRSPNARGMAENCASPTWRLVAEQIAGWRSIWTTNGVSDTALWVRPTAEGNA
jgi:hypothetical protein